MKEHSIGIILLDGAILFAVSIALAQTTNFVFLGLKGPKDNPIVTSIEQGKLDGLAKTLDKLAKESGANAIGQADEHGRSALMRACYANLANDRDLAELDGTRVPMVALLLDRGADINLRDNDDWTPLMWAAWSGLPKVADTLLARGAEVATADRQGNTALIIAARRGHADIVKALLAKGADKTHRNKAGATALATAERGLAEHPPRFYKARQDRYHATITALR
jgi:ankyrin repeat protein